MGSAYHVNTAFRHFPSDESSVEYKALSAVAKSVKHPQRTLLSLFLQQAASKELAAQLLLDFVSDHGTADIQELLAAWISVLEKVRPVVYDGLKASTKQSVWQRDGGRCCISGVQLREDSADAMFVYPIHPSLLWDLDAMKCAEYSPRVHDFVPCTRIKLPHFITLENGAADHASLPAPELLEVHRHFAESLAWLEVSRYMEEKDEERYHLSPRMFPNEARGSPMATWGQWWSQTVSATLSRIWTSLPAALRTYAYKQLASVSHRFYGYTGSDNAYRFPFNFYLRMACSEWASKHKAEARSLQLVERFTSLPAPRLVDVVESSGSSFLLMTGLPGKGLGTLLHTMTDKQVDTIVQDLKNYVTQLRHIPRQLDPEFHICNALGGGILDWRIPDSKREELRFRDEAEFNAFLVYDLPLDQGMSAQISRSHGIQHDTVFTHADLNMRNILVDEDMKISGIVDWECAGWYPEYWEYTKAHFGARVITRWIVDVLDQVFEGYREELKTEDLLASLTPPW